MIEPVEIAPVDRVEGTTEDPNKPRTVEKSCVEEIKPNVPRPSTVDCLCVEKSWRIFLEKLLALLVKRATVESPVEKS